jgi:hypothetical protein
VGGGVGGVVDGVVGDASSLSGWSCTADLKKKWCTYLDLDGVSYLTLGLLLASCTVMFGTPGV